MKKNYEDPIFEITKFSFEEILANGYVDPSNTEETVGTDGGGEFPFEE